MRTVKEYPESAKNDTLKIRHLIGEANTHGEMVVGDIGSKTIQVWPGDDIGDVVDWTRNSTQ